jgi:hypothetical protein
VAEAAGTDPGGGVVGLAVLHPAKDLEREPFGAGERHGLLDVGGLRSVLGVKMPRGDKQHILNYQIPVPPLPEQQKIVSEIEKIEMQITDFERQLSEIPKQKEEILKKYL